MDSRLRGNDDLAAGRTAVNSLSKQKLLRQFLSLKTPKTPLKWNPRTSKQASRPNCSQNGTVQHKNRLICIIVSIKSPINTLPPALPLLTSAGTWD
jgi:hypothetical protein